ncbi:hypothetical protein [Lacipirellula sp.]|uniref:hypothetical protein n=1 Tax=Lacipirellula sp. TaxID=2691419 RepID=UPI003D0C6F51
MAVKFRTICMGVNNNPHQPHQPSKAELNVAFTCDLTPHARQQISGRLDVDVNAIADHTRCEM